MSRFLPAPVKGVLAVLCIVLNTLWLFPILMVFAVIKLLIPTPSVRKGCTIVLNRIAWFWIGFNNVLADVLHNIKWDVRGAEGLSREHWYFVTCNHRHTKEQIARRPELKGKDVEATRAACEKFRYTPVTIFNFMEGTRLTPAKHQSQNSPHKHLLRPRAGGTAFVLEAMGESLHTMLDVTIVYPDGKSGIWDYLCGRIQRIVVDIRVREIPQRFLGMDYENNRETRADFQRWVSQIWEEKDALIDELKRSPRAL